ncbi:MAG: SO_0444 family Cu/Zn efflux transporter [Muribaculaceae bacterium]
MINFLDTLLALLNQMSPYLLLGFLAAGVLHVFVPEDLLMRHFSASNVRSVIKAALLGVPLPLCSCGVLPTAVGLRNSGASRAASTSFLIATPQTGVDSIAATYSLLGPAFAVLRPLAALVTALFGGVLVSAVEQGDAGVKKADDLDCDSDSGCCSNKPTGGIGAKLWASVRYGLIDMMQSMGRWLVVGLVVAALITVLVPDEFFAEYAQYPLLNMLIVLVVSVPMYVCATGSIPIAMSLMLKGLTPGAAFVLLMAGPAANFASVLVIGRAFGRKSTVAYLASIVSGAVAFGLLIDYVLPAEWFAVNLLHGGGESCSHCVNWLNIACSVVLVVSLIYTQLSRFVKSKSIITNNMTKEYKVKGMMCVHCKANVEKGLQSIEGVTRVEADLAKGVVYVEGDVPAEVIEAKVKELGYEWVG